ncbi:gamete-expressed 3 [Wolffia australiana]
MGGGELRLSSPYVGYDGKVYVCCRKSILAFETDGSVAWIIPLNYSCQLDIAPVGDERGKIFFAAENRILKVKPANMGTSESVVEIIYDPNPEIRNSGEIIGFGISIPSSALFLTAKKLGIFAVLLRGTPLWSAVPNLNRSGFVQGCKNPEGDCYFNSGPVVDQCEGTLYVSTTDGQLYAMYTLSPDFRWIKDLSWVDKIFLITPGNNGHVYITFPKKSILMALDVSTGNMLWMLTVGPLGGLSTTPVVDSNGWVSIGSLDGYLYSVSPAGDLRKLLKSSASDSVIRVGSLLDCSGFSLFVAQSHVNAKINRIVGNQTYVSAAKTDNLMFFMLSPSTGAIHYKDRASGDQLSRSDLRFFKSDERLLLALQASGRKNSPWPCYTARQKLSWTCSQANPKIASIYPESEITIFTLLIIQLTVLLLLTAAVRFCWVFWRKKELKKTELGKFLEGRETALTSTTSDLAAVNGQECQLAATYSLGRDVAGGRVRSPLLPLFGGRPKSHSFDSRLADNLTALNSSSSRGGEQLR